MQILIVGFQRSGTTLMRRILTAHPHIRVIFHELFLLRQCDSKVKVMQFLDNKGVHISDQNWGEKCPFYPNVRGIPVVNYCKKWTEYFGPSSRILHTVRHPIDVALSVEVKAKGKGRKFKPFLHEPLSYYQRVMRIAIPKIANMKNAFTYKYEDLLMNQDEMLPRIFEFCGIDKDIDHRAAMSYFKQTKYRTIDPSRAFTHKRNPMPKFKIDLRSTINVINDKLGGVEYTI